MSESGEDLCATCGHRRRDHGTDGPCHMVRLPSVHSTISQSIPCECEKFLDARDLTFNLQEEARDGE